MEGLKGKRKILSFHRSNNFWKQLPLQGWRNKWNTSRVLEPKYLKQGASENWNNLWRGTASCLVSMKVGPVALEPRPVRRQLADAGLKELGGKLWAARILTSWCTVITTGAWYNWFGDQEISIKWGPAAATMVHFWCWQKQVAHKKQDPFPSPSLQLLLVHPASRAYQGSINQRRNTMLVPATALQGRFGAKKP